MRLPLELSWRLNTIKRFLGPDRNGPCSVLNVYPNKQTGSARWQVWRPLPNFFGGFEREFVNVG